LWPGDEWVLKEALFYYYQTPILTFDNNNPNPVPKISQISYHAVYNTYWNGMICYSKHLCNSEYV